MPRTEDPGGPRATRDAELLTVTVSTRHLRTRLERARALRERYDAWGGDVVAYRPENDSAVQEIVAVMKDLDAAQFEVRRALNAIGWVVSKVDGMQSARTSDGQLITIRLELLILFATIAREFWGMGALVGWNEDIGMAGFDFLDLELYRAGAVRDGEVGADRAT